MTTVAFDTLKLATKLEEAGFTTAQAKGASSAIADAFSDEIVTKTYLDNRLELTKSYLDTRLESTKSDILKWMIGTMGFQTIVILGAVLALSRFGH
jgi:hypothetical protein